MCDCDCESDSVAGVKIGQKVPDFTLDTYDPGEGEFGKLSLAKQLEKKRWTLLFFYPADFTFVCATEFAALEEKREQFAKLGCDIVTVSTDTHFVHLAWRQHERELQNVRYQMGSDANGELSRLFGIYDDASGTAFRGAYLINPEGLLLTIEVNVNNVGRNVDEILRKLKANIYTAKNSNEVCPAKWRDEGDKTLVPSAKLVGKVHEALNG